MVRLTGGTKISIVGKATGVSRRRMCILPFHYHLIYKGVIFFDYFQAIIWLEKYLHSWASTILVVSHDRSFLDEVPTDILHIHSQRIDTYRWQHILIFLNNHAAEL